MNNPSFMAKKADRESLFRQIVAHIKDAVMLVDANGTVRGMNPAAERLFASAAGNMVGKKFPYPVHSGMPGCKPIAFQKVIVERLGDILTVEMNTTEIKLHGETFFMASLRDITELVELREEKKDLPLIDEVTGLYNRRGFSSLAQYQFRMAERSKKGMWLLIANIANFATIVNMRGYDDGKKALLEAADILEKSFRASDVIARIDDNEFAIIAIGANRDSANALEARLHKNVDATNALQNRSFKLVITTGMAYYDPEVACSIDELLIRARNDMLTR